jgi:hypothetical protein
MKTLIIVCGLFIACMACNETAKICKGKGTFAPVVNKIAPSKPLSDYWWLTSVRIQGPLTYYYYAKGDSVRYILVKGRKVRRDTVHSVR